MTTPSRSQASAKPGRVDAGAVRRVRGRDAPADPRVVVGLLGRQRPPVLLAGAQRARRALAVRQPPLLRWAGGDHQPARLQVAAVDALLLDHAADLVDRRLRLALCAHDGVLPVAAAVELGAAR
jgi:hypothetical protein